MAQCMYPFRVENPRPMSQAESTIPVPCGRCPECLKRRASIWSYRLRKEEERSISALFVTLTYDSLYIPLTKNKFMTLNKKDVQDFFKRLRKINKNGRTIKYYCAGEYGTNTRRPHYHIIIFNSTDLDIHKAWIHPETKKPIGQIHIGTVTGASIGYTIKYINKGKFKLLHKNDDRVPEFSLMSKRLGDNYITKQTIQYHRNDLSKAYLTIEDGIRISIPRYYKGKIFPITANQKIIDQDPSILILFEENKKLLKKQNDIVKKIIEEKKLLDTRTDKEIHEAKAIAIHNFNKKYKTSRK